MKIVIGLAVLLAVFLMFGSFSDPDGAALKRRSIELCWSEQSRKSLDADAARFAAGACERMESDYTARFGRRP